MLRCGKDNHHLKKSAQNIRNTGIYDMLPIPPSDKKSCRIELEELVVNFAECTSHLWSLEKEKICLLLITCTVTQYGHIYVEPNS